MQRRLTASVVAAACVAAACTTDSGSQGENGVVASEVPTNGTSPLDAPSTAAPGTAPTSPQDAVSSAPPQPTASAPGGVTSSTATATSAAPVTPPNEAGAGGQGGGAGVSAVGGAAVGGTAGSAGGSGETSGGFGGRLPEGGSGGTSGAGGTLADGPNVDSSDPQLYSLQFRSDEADPNASQAVGNQFAYLDTRTAPRRELVVYLHGAGDFTNCGDGALGELVASFGYHWFGPCYSSNYGVDNCGNDIAGCRLEAFEGEDHHPFVNITRPNSIEERVVRGLAHLNDLNPEGDWDYYLDGEVPRWSEIIITGHSHGASSSGVIGMNRRVARVVMLAGPYDVDQPWLTGTPLTPRSSFFGFTHSGDGQHQGHLAALESLEVPGQPVSVDNVAPPYDDSQRLISSASVGDPHGSVTSGNILSFIPAWIYLYGASE